jgi:hypothetical protein
MKSGFLLLLLTESIIYDLMKTYLTESYNISHTFKNLFLAAVARPRFLVIPSEVFDGKIGIWGFFEHTPAKRSSKNRAAGTMEVKCVNVTKACYREMLISDLLPAIHKKWPTGNQ